MLQLWQIISNRKIQYLFPLWLNPIIFLTNHKIIFDNAEKLKLSQFCTGSLRSFERTAFPVSSPRSCIRQFLFYIQFQMSKKTKIKKCSMFVLIHYNEIIHNCYNGEFRKTGFWSLPTLNKEQCGQWWNPIVFQKWKSCNLFKNKWNIIFSKNFIVLWEC